MEDREIYKLLENNSNAGINALLNKYGGLFSYISKNNGVNNKEDLEECISDILYTVWNKIDNYDKTKSSFKTWVLLVARCCSIDYIRKNKPVSKIVSFDELEEYRLAKDEKEINQVIDIIQKLKPPDNRIFYRKFVLGESVKMIADRLKLTTSNVYKRISRGREKLQKLIKEELI